MSGGRSSPSLQTLFNQYRHGADELLQRMSTAHPRYGEAGTYQRQLEENLARELYGETPNGKAERTQILSRLDNLCLSVLRITFDELCNLLPPAAEPQPTGFVNRAAALRQLEAERLRASKSPYVLITAPAGYGKTYLLQHTRAQLTHTHGWQCRYVSCIAAGQENIVQTTRALTQPSLATATPVTIPAICATIFQTLTTSDDPAITLFFDNLEKLAPTARDWLHQLLHTLYLRSRLGHRELHTVRIILAGRETASFWDAYAQRTPRPPVPRRINLLPFDQPAIEDLLWQQATALHIQDNLEGAVVTQLSAELHYLSGGHPQVAHDLVADLAQQYFAIGPVAAYFAQNRVRLVQTYLAPVAETLLQDLPATVAQAARALSLFRRVNANTVQALMEAQKLPPNSQAIALLGDLVKAQLLISPNLREPFFRAHLARHVLALNMAYRSEASQAQYCQLNQVACDLYARWIRQGLPDPHFGPAQRLLSVVEWLYHALLNVPFDLKTLQAQLLKHLHILCTSPESIYVIDLIIDEIRQDAEIVYLLTQCLGENGINIICDGLIAYQPNS